MLGQLVRGNALLACGNEVHGHEPLDEWQLGVLQQRADKTGEVPSALLAAELAVLARHAMVTSAIRAHDIAVQPAALCDGLPALFLGGEVRSEGNDVVKTGEIYYNQ